MSLKEEGIDSKAFSNPWLTINEVKQNEESRGNLLDLVVECSPLKVPLLLDNL